MPKSFASIIIALLCCKMLPAQEAGMVESGNATIFFRSFGQGTPILIINGGPGMNSDGFEGLARRLSDRFKTIIYDQRGTGKSFIKPPDDTRITMMQMVDDIEALRRHLHIDQWIVFGHSFGGMLASYYACFYRQRILAMVLSSSGGLDLDLLSYVGGNIQARLSPAYRDSVSYFTNRINGGDTSHATRLKRGIFLAGAYVFDQKNIPVIAERLSHSKLSVNNLLWEDMRRIKFDCTKQLLTFTKPVLIIQGEEDIIEKRTALKEARVFSHSRFFFVGNCVHYGWLDNPKSYFTQLDQFLSPFR